MHLPPPPPPGGGNQCSQLAGIPKRAIHLRSRPGERAQVPCGHEGIQLVAVVVGEGLGQPHVCQLGAIIAVQQDVGRLQVKVHLQNESLAKIRCNTLVQKQGWSAWAFA